jgi:hypothetical protein
MGKIKQCVSDVLHIAYGTGDVDQAKTRVEELLLETKTKHRGQLAALQRVRDHLNEAYDDQPADSQVCLDNVLDWLNRELERR